MIAPPHSGTFQRSLDKLAPRSNRARVLPSIDLNSGIVLLIMRGELVQRWHPKPRILEATLAKAIRPVLWDQSAEVLWVATAAAGYRTGKETAISLYKRPSRLGSHPRPARPATESGELVGIL